MTEPKTFTLDVPGAVLHYDVRSNDAGAEPVLLLIGSPMGAAGFGTLAGHFTDRTVVTYDPRGSERSRRTDGAAETTPDEHADDLHRLIAALDAGPVDLFAGAAAPSTRSSWSPGTRSRSGRSWRTSRRPSRSCRTASRRWPPASTSTRPTCAAASARRWRSSSPSSCTRARFRKGSPTGRLRTSPPSGCRPRTTAPATTRWSGQNMISCTHYRHDFDAIRAASTRVVIGVGAESGKVITGRSAVAVAERLGTAPVTFPGGHDGFLGGRRAASADVQPARPGICASRRMMPPS